MTSQHETPQLSKAESARINGAKSRGATSDQGKINSANGNLRHGAYSKRILMDGESAEGYEQFKSHFVELFKPTDTFEAECVDSMVTTRWRIRRLEGSEASNLNTALLVNKEANDAKFDDLDVLHERGIAVQSQIAFLDASSRVQERLHRIYERNYKLLANYRRKSGRTVPASEPRASASGPPPPDLTNHPTGEPDSVTPAASIIAKVAMFLVIFSLLLLTPVTTKAKTSVGYTPVSAFHASASPAPRFQR